MSIVAKQAARSLNSTIRLPKTTFPARASAEDLSRYLTRCSDDLYSWQSRKRSAEETFILHDGPPYANGDLHIGHALNKILKDMINRFHLGQGKRIEYVPGWDCHGLPIELKALQQHQLNAPKHDTPPTPIEVRQIARKLAETTVELQKNQFRAWGVMGDWTNAWKTMDQDFELRQLFIFLALFTQGLITRKHKPVYWSPSSRTALAEGELEYNEEHESTATLVAIRIDAPRSLRAGQFSGLKALIWTTTPWTLPANQAIALRDDMLYTIVDSKNFGHLLVAKSCLQFVRGKVDDELSIIQDDVPGSFFTKNGFTYTSVFDQSDVARPVVAAPFVTDSTGTGLVHCAPGHGMEDYDALRQYINQGKVKVKAPIDDGGLYTVDAMPDDPKYLQGSDILGNGQKKILDFLLQRKMLLSSYPYKHKYPYDWRTKQPIVIRATEQWFADVHSIKNKSVQALSAVRFLPSTGKSRLRSFLEHRDEWCISRQRAWGVPIPAIYDRRTGEAIMTDQTVAHIMQVVRDRGTDAWWSDPEDDPAWIHPRLLLQSTPGDYRRGADTLDVWFDSGTSWAQLMDQAGPAREPLADLYIEGTDQHRGWFQSSLLTRIAYQTAGGKDIAPHAPFASLITHGFTLDEQGRKMSKSIGNVVSPTDIIRGTFHKQEQAKTKGKSRPASDLGPEVLRLWVASSDFTTDIVVSQQTLSNVQGALHKFRTTFKLLLGALTDFNSHSSSSVVPTSKLAVPDLIALWRLEKMDNEVLSSYQKYEFHKAVTAITRYINSDLSASYIESIKDRLYCEATESHSRRSAQTVLWHVFTRLQALLSPVCPLLVEETWTHSPESLKKDVPHPFHSSWALPSSSTTVPQTGFTFPFSTHWDVLTQLSSTIKSLQERARDSKHIRTSLQSSVTILIPSTSSSSSSDSAPTTTTSSSTTPALSTLLAEYGGPSKLTDLFVVSGVDIAVTDPVSPQPQTNEHRSRDDDDWIYSSTISVPIPVPGTGGNGTAKTTTTTTTKVTIELRPPPSADKCDRCWKYTVGVQRDGSGDGTLENKPGEPPAEEARQTVYEAFVVEEKGSGKRKQLKEEGGEQELSNPEEVEKATRPKLCERCVGVLAEMV